MVGKKVPYLLVLMFLFNIACEAKTMNFYKKDQINTISIEKSTSNKLLLSVTPLLETAHALSGAKIVKNNDGINVSLVRCRLNAECEVDVAAKALSDVPGTYIIAIPMTNETISIDYQSHIEKIWP